MTDEMRRVLGLVVASTYLATLVGQAPAEPLALQGRQPAAVASLGSGPNSCQLPPDFLSRLGALKERAQQDGSPGVARINVLPRQESKPAIIPHSKLIPKATAKAPSSVTTFGRLLLAFIENQGQVDEHAKFYLKTSGQTLWITREGIVFDLIRPLTLPSPLAG